LPSYRTVSDSVKKLRYSVEVKFNSSGRIQVNGKEITMSIKSEPKHGKANREMIKKISNFFEQQIFVCADG
jgi:uncharacterized protein YggU (UPF0235/DUF167 family)